jgi:hypothetical protein
VTSSVADRMRPTPDDEGRQWAATYGEDVAGAWRGCPRGDWLLALAVGLQVAHSAIALAARDCAALAPVPPSESARRTVADALETIDLWARSEATAADCHAAAVSAANTATPAGFAASYACFTVSAVDYAPMVTSWLDLVVDADRAAILARSADAVRARIPESLALAGV